MYELRMITPAGHWTEQQPLTVQAIRKGSLPEMVRQMRAFVAAAWPEGFAVTREDGRVVTSA